MKNKLYCFIFLSIVLIKNSACMDKPGEGYKKSAMARLTRSTSETIVRCQEQKDVLERLKILAIAKKTGRDTSPEFLNFNLIAADNGQILIVDDSAASDQNIPKQRVSLSPVVKNKISETKMRIVRHSGELDLENKLDEQKLTEKVRRNTIPG